MIYITLRAFTGSAATDETSLLLTGQAQGHEAVETKAKAKGMGKGKAKVDAR